MVSCVFGTNFHHLSLCEKIFLFSTAAELDSFRHITRQMRNLFPSMVVQSPRQFAGVMRSRGAVRDPIVLKCKQFVDQEGLTCLLALLVRGYSPAVSLSGNPPGDLPTSAGPGRQLLLCSSVRRLLRNLAYHSPTRHWLLRALLSILHSAAAAAAAPAAASAPPEYEPAMTEKDFETETSVQLNSLLTMSYPVALGCRVPFFIVAPSKRRGAPSGVGEPLAVSQEKERASGDVHEELEVRIHPRVAAFVCKTMLETLADLGQCFYEPLYPNPVTAAAVIAEEQKDSGMDVDISSPESAQQNETLDSADVVDSEFRSFLAALLAFSRTAFFSFQRSPREQSSGEFSSAWIDQRRTPSAKRHLQRFRSHLPKASTSAPPAPTLAALAPCPSVHLCRWLPCCYTMVSIGGKSCSKRS